MGGEAKTPASALETLRMVGGTVWWAQRGARPPLSGETMRRLRVEAVAHEAAAERFRALFRRST